MHRKYCTYWAVSSILPESCLSPGSFEVKETPFLGSISLPLFGTVHGFLLTDEPPRFSANHSSGPCRVKIQSARTHFQGQPRESQPALEAGPGRFYICFSVGFAAAPAMCEEKRGPGDKHHSDTGGVSSSFLNLRPAPSHQHHNFLWHLRQTYVIFSSTTL